MWQGQPLGEKKKVLYFNHCQDLVQTVDKQDTGESIVPLCLDKVGQSLKFLLHRKSLSLAAAD